MLVWALVRELVRALVWAQLRALVRAVAASRRNPLSNR